MICYFIGFERNHTTAFSDYQNPKQGKTVPNPVVVNNVRVHLLFIKKSIVLLLYNVVQSFKDPKKKAF